MNIVFNKIDYYITYMVNKSLRVGICPSELKIAKVVLCI